LRQDEQVLFERPSVSALSDELSLAQMSMTDSQQQQLTKIMYDERTAIPPPDVQDSAANSSDARRALQDWESALEQRVQERAGTVLSSAQQTRRPREALSVFAMLEVPQGGDTAAGATPP
jgi:hypothetical protein